jgi:FtsP/CotA-like multicopper oxidase with cupredoxin domain
MNNSLRRSIQQILLAGSAAAFAAGTLAAAGQQNPPPGPGHIPDYFGVVPNYATSPQPILTKVTVDTGSAVPAGSGALATANLGAGGAIASITKTNGGSGYVTPKVTITDQGLGGGASVTVTTTATSGGFLTGVPSISNPGSDCALGDPVVITGTGSGALASVTGVNNGAVTEVTLDNPGQDYTGTTASFEVTCSGINGVLNASGTIAVSPGTPGEISGITISLGGQNYVPNAKVIFADPNRTATGNTDAVAHVTTVDTNGAITGIMLDNPGTGYTATTTAEIVDVGTGIGATATATAKKVGGVSGVITGVKVTAAGSGYRNPLVEITDANAGAAGQGAVLVATTYDYATDQQTDKVMDIQVLNPGTGYDAGTTVKVTGGPGSTELSLIPLIENGSIVGIDGLNIPDPNDPTVLIRDPLFTGFSGSFKTPIAGSGIRKFVDSLPNLNAPNNLGQQMPLAVADTTTFTGDDYYEIAEVEYTQKLHSDLPATHLRGYVQIKTGGFTVAGFNAASDKLAYASQYAGYLGPVIVAQKDKPVRVKLVNLLSTDSAGKLPVPVDTTYMGADTANATENRAALHLHGGNTPWISDGTPRQWVKPKGETGDNKGESARDVPDMWFDANGDLLPNLAPTAVNAGCRQGTTTCTTPGATNNPGDGALTFFFTNEQSARLMFYHDHAEGITRLNVYAGVAAGYVLQDPTEQDLVNGTNVSGNNTALAQVLPSLADTIPLAIQEKTFVPDNTQPVLNFYGPFASQLNSQDPTWRWGTGAAATGTMGNGDLWVPHVFMPNQNPGDITGANAVGRWDYGAWFWPPFANLQNGPIANPYYDPLCNTTTDYCEGPEIPGVPNGSLQTVYSNGIKGGVADATKGGAITESPSGTPEAFNDTPLVNGTAYPYINVDPKPYRLRILSVGNDRMLNLSLVMAASKNADSTALGNAGPSSTAPAVLCDGVSAYPTGHPLAGSVPTQADCTEVKMVPFDATQNKAANTPFPAHWYSPQKGGVTFDGRPSGVFDPKTRGPAMVQIGTEGGFLSTPVVIKNQPVNYEYNPKNILIGNIKEHALLLGPAERADVLVDFTNFAGTTLLMYNDAGAPVPAWDLRLDYYTGNFDNTDTGGAFSVIPGYGPNSRTLMQIRVSGTGGGSHPVDDLGTINMATLIPAIQTAFKTSQEPIIVPQAAYNSVYGISATDAIGSDLSSIFSTHLNFKPLSLPGINGVRTLMPLSVNLELEPKTIIEDWTQNWGRMNALLGTEVPHTTAINQTSIPQAYVDPATELVKITPNDNMIPVTGTLPDGTQLWKVTHNGVDSHAIHFHLFHVQLVNRVGWDGAIYPPEANELGWKDTVLMHPLSDVIVAMRPMVMNNVPFKVPNSHRLLDPAKAAGGPSEFFNFNPLDGNASDVTNLEVNYGWEYVWHCHILGHEENDMMRTIAVAQPPEAPAARAATGAGTSVTVNWTDNSIISNWVTIQRSTSQTFATVDATFNVLVPECTSQAGCTRTYTDTTAPAATSVHYRVMANNTVGAGDGKLDTPRNPDGSYGGALPAELSTLTPGFAGYANVTANSVWSNTVSRKIIPVANVTPGSIVFPQTNIGSTNPTNTAGRKVVTISNTGNGPLIVSGISLTGPFARGTSTSSTNTLYRGSCPTTGTFSLNPSTSCTYNVTFSPTAALCTGANCNGTLTVTDNSNGVAGSTQTVTLSGTTVVPTPVVNLSTTALNLGNIMVGNTATQAATLNNTGTGALSIANVTVSGTGFTRVAGGCGATLNAGSSCNITVQAAPTATGAMTGNLVITDNTNGVAGSTQTVSLAANGIPLAVTAVNDTATATTTMLNSIGTQTVTVNVRANDTPANTGTVTILGAVVKSGNPVPTATATAAVTNGNVVLSLTATGPVLSAARTASKRGVYTVTYLLNVNGTTSQATATITVN